jgi:carbon monoxide dehydrogenase subunit G
MQKVNYDTTVNISLDVLWNFMKDFSNWGPMVKGYQSHEILNEKESVWTLKGEFGSFSRRTKFHTTITDWIPKEKVAFEMKGLNEPVSGYGVVQLASEVGQNNTRIFAEAGFNAGGAMGPLINRMVKPWAETVAEELVLKLVEAVRTDRIEVAVNARVAEEIDTTDNLQTPDTPIKKIFILIFRALNKIFKKLYPQLKIRSL